MKRRSVLWTTALLAGGWTVTAQEPTEEVRPASVPPSVVREKVREWVRVQKTLSAEAADWEEGKASMADLNELRKREIAQIDELITAAGSRLADAEERLGELKAEEVGLRDARAEMEKRVIVLEGKLRSQLPMFPPPVREKAGEALARLENPDDKVPLQNRFRDVLLILGVANQFHHSLTVESEIRELGGDRVEVDVLYLGFSGAWYVDRAGRRAGSGRPGAKGWEWKENDRIANLVREAIAMHRRKATPGFIGLPFEPSKVGSP